MLKRLISSIATSERFIGTILPRALTRRIVVLMYHELAEDDDDIEAWTVVRRSSFLRQVEYLRKHFEVVSLEHAVTHGPNHNGPRPFAVVTFDDGDRGNASVLLPLVRDLDLPVAVFVATRHVAEQESYWFDAVVNALQTAEPVQADLTAFGLGRYELNVTRGAANWAAIQRVLADLKSLSPDARERAVTALLDRASRWRARPGYRIAPLDREMLRSLADCHLVTIGAHSHCHNILTQIGIQQAIESISVSKRLLETWTGKEVWSFAYPNGDWDDSLAEAVRQAGFRCAFATGERVWDQSSGRFAIPRIGVGRYDSMDTFKLNLLAGRGRATFLQRRSAAGARGEHDA